jgi:ligand-binding sensor domain-containing protein
LLALRDHGVRNYTVADGLPATVVVEIYPDGDDALWVGTAGGLARVVDGRVTSLAAGGGVLRQSILGIVADLCGELWLTTNKGLYSVDRKALAAFADGAGARRHGGAGSRGLAHRKVRPDPDGLPDARSGWLRGYTKDP